MKIKFKQMMFNKWSVKELTLDEAVKTAFFCIDNNIPWSIEE